MFQIRDVFICIRNPVVRVRILLFSLVIFKMPKSKFSLSSFFACTYGRYGTFTSVIKDNKLLRSKKSLEIQVFSFFYGGILTKKKLLKIRNTVNIIACRSVSSVTVCWRKKRNDNRPYA